MFLKISQVSQIKAPMSESFSNKVAGLKTCIYKSLRQKHQKHLSTIGPQNYHLQDSQNSKICLSYTIDELNVTLSNFQYFRIFGEIKTATIVTIYYLTAPNDKISAFFSKN